MVNVTNSRSGCAGMLAAGALEAAAAVVDGVMGPPEDDATFARITDRCSRPAGEQCSLGSQVVCWARVLGLLRLVGCATTWLVGGRRAEAS